MPEEKMKTEIDAILDTLPPELHTAAIADNTGTGEAIHGPYELEDGEDTVGNLEIDYSIDRIIARRRF